MATNRAVEPHIYLLFLQPASHRSKIGQNWWYDSTVLIAPEGRNTRGIWCPPCCGHQKSGFFHVAIAWRQIHVSDWVFRTGASIRSRRQFQKWSCLHGAIAAFPRAWTTAPPRRWHDLQALQWQVQWLCIPFWFLSFEVSLSFLLTYEFDCSFGLLLSFWNT